MQTKIRFIFKNFSSSSLYPPSNINNIFTPCNCYQTSIKILPYVLSILPSFLQKSVNIPPSDHFGEMYTIYFPIVGSNMVQHESFDLDPATSIFTMCCKIPDSSSIETSPEKNLPTTTTKTVYSRKRPRTHQHSLPYIYIYIYKHL